MTKNDIYWKTNREWWYYDENLSPVLKENAPLEAKRSYENYLKQIKEENERYEQN